MTVNVTNAVGANNTIVLDGSSKIPAFDGSQVTALDADVFTTGTLATARIDVGTTAGKILQLDSNAKIPAISGANLTNAPGPTVSTSDPAIDTNPTLGAKWINKTSGEVYICTDATAGANVWTNVGAGSGDVRFFSGSGSSYGYISGGGNRGVTIERFSFASDGNAVDAGQDASASYSEAGGSSSATHGYIHKHTGAGDIRKYQFNTSNNMTLVGYLTTGTSNRAQNTGTESSTHGYVFGGSEGTEVNIIEKFNYSTDGNSVDTGDLTQARRYASGHCSFTYGYAAGGMEAPPNYNIIDKWSFSSDGNATDVGDLTRTLGYIGGGVQSETYGYSCGGSSPFSNIIDKFSFSADANATDVGDLTQARGSKSDCSSETHGYCVQGWDKNVIDKWSFSSDGNATDVGDGAFGSSEGHQCAQV